jgi:hypothetical protein
MFLVCFASKGVRVPVSGLESTHAGICVGVDCKEVGGGDRRRGPGSEERTWVAPKVELETKKATGEAGAE